MIRKFKNTFFLMRFTRDLKEIFLNIVSNDTDLIRNFHQRNLRQTNSHRIEIEIENF